MQILYLQLESLFKSFILLQRLYQSLARVKLSKKKFNKIILYKNIKTFIMYIAYFNLGLILIYLV